MILGIVGSRHYGADGPRRNAHVKQFIAIVDPIVERLKPSRIISGGAPGIDTLARLYAEWKGIQFNEFPENAEVGRLVQRYHARDRRIAKKANELLALPCQHSRGTWATVGYFEEREDKQARVVIVDCTAQRAHLGRNESRDAAR